MNPTIFFPLASVALGIFCARAYLSYLVEHQAILDAHPTVCGPWAHRWSKWEIVRFGDGQKATFGRTNYVRYCATCGRPHHRAF